MNWTLSDSAIIGLRVEEVAGPKMPAANPQLSVEGPRMGMKYEEKFALADLRTAPPSDQTGTEIFVAL